MHDFLESIHKHRNKVMAYLLTMLLIRMISIAFSAWSGEFKWFDSDFWSMVLSMTTIYVIFSSLYEEENLKRER